MSVPGGDNTLKKHEVVYLKEGKLYKYVVIILLSLIFLMTIIYLPKINRITQRLFLQKYHGQHSDPSQEKGLGLINQNLRELREELHTIMNKVNSLQKQKHKYSEWISERQRQLLRSETNQILSKITQKMNSFQQKLASNRQNGSRRWRSDRKWVDEELEKAKRQFKQKYQNRFDQNL